MLYIYYCIIIRIYSNKSIYNTKIYIHIYIHVYICVYIHRDISYKEQTHMITEVKKYCNMPSASWWTRKAGGVVLVRVWRSESSTSANGVSPSWSAEDQYPSSTVRQKEWILPSSTSVLFRTSVDWMMPTHTGEGSLPYSGYQLKY